MRLAKPFYGVPDGEIYPRWYQAGEDCPPELLEAAKAVGAVEETKEVKPRATKK